MKRFEKLEDRLETVLVRKLNLFEDGAALKRVEKLQSLDFGKCLERLGNKFEARTSEVYEATRAAVGSFDDFEERMDALHRQQAAQHAEVLSALDELHIRLAQMTEGHELLSDKFGQAWYGLPAKAGQMGDAASGGQRDTDGAAASSGEAASAADYGAQAPSSGNVESSAAASRPPAMVPMTTPRTSSSSKSRQAKTLLTLLQEATP